MKIKILRESGYEEALFGIGLSFGVTDFSRLEKVATVLFNKDGGHNKFLESIQLWIEITAPRYWWQEFDTYRVGITKQSESTIHTIMKSKLNQSHFESPLNEDILEFLNICIQDYKNSKSTEQKKQNFKILKNHLPEGFLQKRIVNTNYKVLRNILQQRKNHKLDEWRVFNSEIYNQVYHVEFLMKGK